MEISFYELTPDHVMSALESQGFAPTGRFFQLNSYENRVFDVELEDHTRIITKFYRPQRWSVPALQAEHEFLEELQNAGLHTSPALKLKNSTTIAESFGIFWAVFPKIMGRMPQELLPDDLTRVGRVLALLHNTGAQKPAPARPQFDLDTFGHSSLKILEQWISPELWPRYLQAATILFDEIEDTLQYATHIRIHGDCHRGNLLERDNEFFFVDFDDFCNGPTAQDFWMLTAGDIDEREQNLEALLKGYEELRHFDDNELELFEPLRGLRLIHYSAWIAKRWEDPSFPKLFPNFNSYNYWSEEIEALEKIAWSL